MIEKYGGIWVGDSDKSLEVIHERHDVKLDIIEAIYRRKIDGFYTVALFVKAEEPQWRLPIWHNTEKGSIFESLEIAEGHLRSTLGSSFGHKLE